MVFHWSLSDSKSPQVSRTIFSILAIFNNAVVWIVFICPPTSKSSRPFNNPFVTVPNAPITIGIIVIFMFHRFYYHYHYYFYYLINQYHKRVALFRPKFNDGKLGLFFIWNQNIKNGWKRKMLSFQRDEQFNKKGIKRISDSLEEHLTRNRSLQIFKILGIFPSFWSFYMHET